MGSLHSLSLQKPDRKPQADFSLDSLSAPLSQTGYLAPRTTRSKKVFSPWDVVDVSLTNPGFCLDGLLEAKAQKDSQHPDGIFDEDEMPHAGDESPESKNDDPTPQEEEEAPPRAGHELPGPPFTDTLPSTSQRPPSPPPSRSPLLAPDFEEDPIKLSAKERRRIRRNAANHAARAKRRQNPEFGSTKPRKSIRERYSEVDIAVQVPMGVEECPASSTGYTGLRDTGRGGAVRPLSYFVGEGSKLKFTHQQWDGEVPVALIDSNRRLVGILAGHPTDPNWPAVVRQAEEAIEEARRDLNTKGRRAGRRGDFATLRCGVSHGGGQTKPSTMVNDAEAKKALAKLHRMPFFQRTSSFATSVLATRAPQLHQHYSQKMRQLYERDKTLERPFPTSIFSATTYNLGPRTLCHKHHDGGNYRPGMCAITSAGTYNHHLGGHLVLWECQLVIDFPPGSTILIPSAIVAHSNTSIGKHETRYSFTQYTSGALFRWVDNNFQSAVAYRQSLSTEEKEKERLRDSNRWREELSLLPIVTVKPSRS